ncbi:MAG: hypothetical protein CMN41_08890 [SAR116 cluster bacterium]|nr:hypothetical protein [SAR116 cluster bacterium]
MPDRIEAPECCGNSLAAIMAGVVVVPADACANLWNLSPDERAGQPGVRPVTVTPYIAPSSQFFQLEIGGR